MAKCQICRGNEQIILTRWELIRYWLFKRLNSVLFPQDFKDETNDFFTKGYSDGYTTGIERERERAEIINKRYGRSGS